MHTPGPSSRGVHHISGNFPGGCVHGRSVVPHSCDRSSRNCGDLRIGSQESCICQALLSHFCGQLGGFVYGLLRRLRHGGWFIFTVVVVPNHESHSPRLLQRQPRCLLSLSGVCLVVAWTENREAPNQERVVLREEKERRTPSASSSVVFRVARFRCMCITGIPCDHGGEQVGHSCSSLEPHISREGAGYRGEDR